MLFLLASAPVSHLSGTILHRQLGYRFWQPLQGGFRFVLTQSLGWLLYAVLLVFAIVGFANNIACSAHIVLPLAVAAQLCISVSVAHYDPESTVTVAATIKKLDEARKAHTLPGVPLFPIIIALLTAITALLFAMHVGVLPTPTRPAVGWKP